MISDYATADYDDSDIVEEGRSMVYNKYGKSDM